MKCWHVCTTIRGMLCFVLKHQTTFLNCVTDIFNIDHLFWEVKESVILVKYNKSYSSEYANSFNESCKPTF